MRAIIGLYGLLQCFNYQKTPTNSDHNTSGATAAENHAVLPVTSMAWLFG